MLPFYDEHGIKALRILTDRGPEYCGRTDTHSYELFLHLNGVEHTKTKPRHPQTNGCVERLNQTVQEEFYKVAFRKKLYKNLEERYRPTSTPSWPGTTPSAPTRAGTARDIPLCKPSWMASISISSTSLKILWRKRR